MTTDLLTIRSSNLPIAELAHSAGRVFQTEFPNDSGNKIFSIETPSGRRLFVKHTDNPRHIERFKFVERMYARLSHPAMPPLRNSFSTAEGFALVFDWLAAEHYAYDKNRSRFAALPPAEKLAAFGTVLDLHVRLESAGYVAEDLYDGSLLYDFAGRRMYMCDLDEYHEGPFVLDRDRTFGSDRFMAPEERVRGSRIDGRTTVFNLARLAAILLGDRHGTPAAFTGTPAMWQALTTATSPWPEDRFGSVSDFSIAWSVVCGTV